MCEKSITIFEKIRRTDTDKARQTESRFTFLNRVANPVFENVRNELELWFSRMTPEAQRDLQPRLRSGNTGEELAAFWELYLHESLIRTGYTLVPHPEVAGQSKHPDFLVSTEDSSFYLEATSVNGSKDDLAIEKHQDFIEEYINTNIKSDFFLNIHYLKTHKSPPSAKKMVASIKQWFTSLDVEQLIKSIRHDGMPYHSWTDGNWTIRFQAQPKSAGARSNPLARTIGSVMGGIEDGDDSTSLYSVIKKKASRYGELDRPYVIAAMHNEFTMNSDDVFDALFGTMNLSVIKETGVVIPSYSRAPNGIWQGPEGVRNTRVSAVLVSGPIYPSTVLRATPVLVCNPFAVQPITDTIPIWPSVTVNVDSGEINRQAEKRKVSDVLDLPDGWPGKPW